MPVHAEERHGRQVGQFQRRLATCFVSWGGGLRQRVADGQKQQSSKGCRSFHKAAFRKPSSHGRKIGVPGAHQNPPRILFRGNDAGSCPGAWPPAGGLHPPRARSPPESEHAPNTLPPPGHKKRIADLAASENLRSRNIVLRSDYTPPHKAIVYSISPEVGSTSVNDVGAMMSLAWSRPTSIRPHLNRAASV